MMFMSNDEIKRSYREAKNQREQITILSQMNCCDEAKIMEILGIADLPAKNGKQRIAGRQPSMRYDDAEIERLYKQGMSDIQIGHAIGCSPSVPKHWRGRNGGLPNNTSTAKKPLSESKPRVKNSTVPMKETTVQDGKSHIEGYIFDSFDMAVFLAGKYKVNIRDIWSSVLSKCSEQMYALSLIFDPSNEDIYSDLVKIVAESALKENIGNAGRGER